MPSEAALFAIAAALAGLLIGSFLNVCIYRMPRDLSVIQPRSFCPECGKPVAWYDNLPLLSFALLKGCCRACGKSIGLRYPLVELTTGLLFGLTVARFGWNLNGLKWCVFDAIMTVLFWTDLEERLLVDEFTLGGSALGVLFAFFTKVPGDLGEMLFPSSGVRWQSLFEAFAGAAALTLPLAALGLIWGRVTKREALGMGDVKLLPCIGLFLGLELGIQTLLLGSLLGVFIGGIYILVRKKNPREYWLPLGSFYCATAAITPLFIKF